jgi:serine/threonine-protein kinase Chk2
VLIKDLSSAQLKVENNLDAWGYLVRVGGETYTLDRELDKRLDNQSAGYIVGKKMDCDIR